MHSGTRPSFCVRSLVALACLTAATASHAGAVSIPAARDATLIESASGAFANGSGPAACRSDPGFSVPNPESDPGPGG